MIVLDDINKGSYALSAGLLASGRDTRLTRRVEAVRQEEVR